MIFSESGFRNAVQQGLCDPLGRITPLVSISRKASSDLRQRHRDRKTKTLLENYKAVQLRMPSVAFGKLRAATDHVVRAAPAYFPAYQLYAGEYLNDEWLSAVDWHKGFHRDHVSHQVMSVYVVRSLISRDKEAAALFKGRPLIDYCLDAVLQSPECEYLRAYLRTLGAPHGYDGDTGLSRHNWEDVLTESLVLAAMYHDCGYPWQFLSMMQEALSSHIPSQNMGEHNAAWTYEHYRERLFMYPLNGYHPPSPTQSAAWTDTCKSALETGLSFSHGMPGARTMLFLNDLLLEYPRRANANPVQRFCVEWAAMGIMMHDLEPLYSGDKGDRTYPHLRVSLTRDPLSFVLTLADQIQDFLRINATFKPEQVDYSSNSSEHIRMSYRSACNAVKLERVGDDLVIKYYYKNQGDLVQNKRKFKPEAQERYFNPHTGYLDYSALPLSRVRLEVPPQKECLPT